MKGWRAYALVWGDQESLVGVFPTLAEAEDAMGGGGKIMTFGETADD